MLILDSYRYYLVEAILEIIAYIFGTSVIRYFLIAGIPFLFFYVLLKEKLRKFKIQQDYAGRKDFIREIWYSTQSTLVFSIITFLILFTPLKKYTLVYDNLSDYSEWYIGGSLILSLVIHDTYFYWIHRLLHHKTLFNRTHLLHHKSINPSPWTSYSFHLLEAIAEGSVVIVVTMLIPIHPFTILLFTVTGFIINVYGHLGYEIMPKWFRRTILFEFFNTSLHHNMHHRKFKWNYGLYFRVWDRIMKTEHPEYVKEYDLLQEQRFKNFITELSKGSIAVKKEMYIGSCNDH